MLSRHAEQGRTKARLESDHEDRRSMTAQLRQAANLNQKLSMSQVKAAQASVAREAAEMRSVDRANFHKPTVPGSISSKPRPHRKRDFMAENAKIPVAVKKALPKECLKRPESTTATQSNRIATETIYLPLGTNSTYSGWHGSGSATNFGV